MDEDIGKLLGQLEVLLRVQAQPKLKSFSGCLSKVSAAVKTGVWGETHKKYRGPLINSTNVKNQQ